MKKNAFIKGAIKKIITSVFLILAKITKTNLTYAGYAQKSILNWGNDTKTGEKFVREIIVKKFISEKPVFFDVGSNVGEYSIALKREYPNAKIYSFEASANTYKKILPEARKENITFLNIGLSSKIGTMTIYDYKMDTWNQHASLYKDVIKDIHNSDEYIQEEVAMDTLDNFCIKNKIETIDFLKIDTEGSELEVLKGAKDLIESNKIKIIQFEFNEMNVISRVFLKDYYSSLRIMTSIE